MSSYAEVWLSRVPAVIPGHFISIRSTGTVPAEVERQAARDWEAFLSLRARELRPGGRLLVVLPGIAGQLDNAGITPVRLHKPMHVHPKLENQDHFRTRTRTVPRCRSAESNAHAALWKITTYRNRSSANPLMLLRASQRAPASERTLL